MIWTGGRSSSGYGGFWVNGKTIGAHQYSYELHFGKVPDGVCVLHNCPGGNDNPLCVNPDHLFLGTHGDNTSDMMRKGRNSDRNGEKNSQAKLTEAQVRQIFQDREEKRMTHQAIADKYNVTRENIGRILSGTNWPSLHR